MNKNYERFSQILNYLDKVIENRKNDYKEKSYISNLIKKNTDRISQKVGEEAVEVVIAANNKNKQNLINESADLLFHLMILWKKKQVTLLEIVQELERRKNE